MDDRYWLQKAIDLSLSCPDSDTFKVGAIVVSADGTVLATGYSGEEDPKDHAEEVAIRRLARDDPRLPKATIYSSLEPCSTRASRPITCTELIVAAGIGRVVLAWREPQVFVDCEGVEILTARGIEVVELSEYADQVREINAHLL
jgi:pyrimidine deaminase RibD-like protein